MSATCSCSSRRKETLFSDSKQIKVSLRRLLQSVLTALFFSFNFCRLTAAEGTAADFDGANKLYEQGKFAEAAAGYQKVLQSGHVSPAVYFNLGNAYFKGGQLGRAITAYREAESLTPRDPDIRANLQFARNQVQGPTISAPGWQRWLNKLSLNEWTWLGAACLWLWFALLIIAQWRSLSLAIPRKVIITLGMITVLVNACLLVALKVEGFTKKAVVVTAEAVVRQGPLDESQTAFTVHDGAELRVLDRKDEWLQVTADPRRIGWVRRDQVLLRPPG